VMDVERVATPRVIPKITEEKKQEELERILKRTTERYGLNKPKTENTVEKVVVEPIPRIPVERPVTLRAKVEEPERDINLSPYKFNALVEADRLTPKGHSRIDSGVRWVKKAKEYVDFVSNYGILRVTPVSEEIIRVQFVRGQADVFSDGNWKYESGKKPAWATRENAAVYDIATAKLVIRMDKKSGALQFYDKKGNVLLKESQKEPRQIEPETEQTWNYFEWEKKEGLTAKGILDSDLEQVAGKARYISIGGKKLRMPLILSGKGYALAVAAKHTVIFCGVASYGQYISTEKATQTEYYFIYGGTPTENIRLYKAFEYQDV